MHFFSSESVSSGHPDKLCDRISDSILDLYLSIDPNSRVAVETLATTDLVVLAGEVSSKADISPKDLEDKVRSVVAEIGYNQPGFNSETLQFMSRLNQQSPDIAMGVDKDGAGDQGIMFGYATRETPNYMPLPIDLAHSLVRTFEQARAEAEYKDEAFFGPDMKSQVTVKYDGETPVSVEGVLVSAQHLDEEATSFDVRSKLMPIIRQGLGSWESPGSWWRPELTETALTNPTGKFHIGGPVGDCGLTGRKIIVDTYGGAAPHGGGAFSGKDPTKVDRSAAYMARYLAKNIVAQGFGEECFVQLAYAIGVAEPVSFLVKIDGVHNPKVESKIMSLLDLSPRGIIEYLDLRRPIYSVTASGGHFGRQPSGNLFPWEELDLREL